MAGFGEETLPKSRLSISVSHIFYIKSARLCKHLSPLVVAAFILFAATDPILKQ